jgi:hypothetical protein
MSESETEPEMVTVTVTCHTENCGNAGHAIVMQVPSDVGGFSCGVCAQPITDIQNESVNPQ